MSAKVEKMKIGWSWKGIVINKPTMATDHERGSRTGKNGWQKRKVRHRVEKELKMMKAFWCFTLSRRQVYYVLKLNEIPLGLGISHWAADQWYGVV